ncbi:drosulfakinins [Drosophila kikkawai]|uniref:Drosulfakinins n=1 Tax=Drosophila kikkawai TaxID=30033 RepID=A0A6P4IC40_DROKI|nr:drosulfakinins [Drosophila kikkawai]KAH8338751.1 hypothetical protein KR059_010808 [Drosophila kikkawai]
MGLRSCSHFASLVIPLWVLALYFLFVVPEAAQATSLDIGKEERRVQDLESKIGAEAGQSGGNIVGLSLSGLGNSHNRVGFGNRVPLFSRPLIPIELDLLLDNDDDRTKAKRFDDYGHMRFGKRGGDDQFDDYGHMRFGR